MNCDFTTLMKISGVDDVCRLVIWGAGGTAPIGGWWLGQC